jgi:hypothetical protein
MAAYTSRLSMIENIESKIQSLQEQNKPTAFWEDQLQTLMNM